MIKKYLRLALAQMNPIIGHLSYNQDKIIWERQLFTYYRWLSH